MRKIVHLPDSSFYSELISNLGFDNETMIYNELTDEMYRFVMPSDTNQTFESWKGNIPRWTYGHRGNISSSIGFGDLSGSYSGYDNDLIFSSDLSPYFMLEVKVYWQKKIGGALSDVGRGICLDSSGNIYLNGWVVSDSYGINDYGVIKLDNNGNIIWQKKIGGTSGEYGFDIAVDSSGNVYATGYQTSDTFGSNNDIGLVKLNSNGNLIWQKKIGGISSDIGYAIAVDGSGNIYLNGNQGSDSYGSNDYGVIKLDTNGNVLWQKKIGSSLSETGYGICLDSSGNIYVVGHTLYESYGGSDCTVIKLDSNGNMLWQKKIGGVLDDIGYDIKADSSGNIYVVGYQSSDVYSGDGIPDYFVFKLNSSGNMIWQKKIGGSGYDYGRGIAIDGSGNVYLNGNQNSDITNGYDYGVIKLDTNGNLLWQKKIGGLGVDFGYRIAVDSSGNIYLNGYEASDSFGGNDYGVMKLYTDQESDMSLSIDNSNFSIGNSTLSIGDMSLSIGTMSLSVGDMSLSIGDIDISGDVGGLVYLG